MTNPEEAGRAGHSPGRARAIALVVAGGAGLVGLSWQLLARPAPWALCEGVVAAGVVAWLGPGLPRTIAVNVAVIALTVLPVELYFGWTADDGPAPPAKLTDAGREWILSDQIAGRAVYQSGGKLVRLHDQLGFVNRAGVSIGERMVRGGRLLYDVTYDTDAHGLRVTHSPYSQAVGAAPVVLFWGCSFVFGQGVEDDETLPSAFEAAAQGRYRALNLGTIGAGTHTVTRYLERDYGSELGLTVPVAAGVYVAIHHHLERITGDVAWAAYYPHYEIRDGALYDAGQFPRRRVLSTGERLLASARRSRLFEHLYQRLPFALGWVDRDGVALFIALVARARERFVEQLGGRFVVVLWDDFGPDQGPITEGLRALGVTFYTHAEVFPEFDPARDYLPEYDHPSPAANTELGAWLAAELAGH